ncbi:hypothetical protein [Candidatus Magnetaquicoccus inordinatus]|uniref:hypothetical protein n=1 Tax=Candidatus Magnetaquicoccus inordinatus TaxID=2496818 RepID=UPI00102C1481|nr:hypothetical protein [Candidatus Magnetaquicoccus inordinatus]
MPRFLTCGVSLCPLHGMLIHSTVAVDDFVVFWPVPVLVFNNFLSKRERNNMEISRNEPVPGMQKLLDNPFALLALGVGMPTVLYLFWGLIELINIPVAK